MIKYSVIKDDDDFLVLVVGETGSGKSTFMLHLYEEILKEKADPDNICFTREHFASTAGKLVDKKGLKFLGYDEANVSRRSWQESFNKDLLDWYWANRGLNIVHVWCNPSLDMIDKPFIDERLKAIVLVRKQPKGMRTWHYFNIKTIKTIFKKYKNLKIDTLNKYRRKYCPYFWDTFPDYTGHLKSDYAQNKYERMVQKTKLFADKYKDSGKILKTGDLAKYFGVQNSVISRYFKKLDGEEIIRKTPGGQSFIVEEDLSKFERLVKNAKNIT